MKACPYLQLLISLSVALGLPLGAPGATTNVVARDFSFSPRDLTVAVGDTVVFSNAGGSHTVSADGTEPFCGRGFFTTCQVTFTTAGTFPYYCVPHAFRGMTGIIRVGDGVSPLTVTVQGNGTVSPDLNGRLLAVGSSYTITAKPGAGFIFAGWTGGISSSQATLTFVMQSNLVLQANFVADPLVRASGSYNGLFYVEDEIRHESSGAFQLRLTKQGKYTGQLQLAGKRRSFSGQFDAQGNGTNSVKRPGTNDLSMEVHLDFSGDSDRIEGNLRDAVAGWSAELEGDLAPVYVAPDASPYRGKYTLILTNEEAQVESGDGFGTVTMTAKGQLTFHGTLADGTPVTQSVPVSKDGQWPLYVGLYGGTGSILSWVTLSTNPAPDASLYGELSWIKPTLPKAKYYPGGFTNELDIVGSLYVPPGTNRVLDLRRGALIVSGGNLSQAFTNTFTLSPKNRLTNQTTLQPLVMTLTLPTGLYRGTLKVNDGGVNKTLALKGALLQHQNRGAGFFLGTNETGEVRFEPTE